MLDSFRFDVKVPRFQDFMLDSMLDSFCFDLKVLSCQDLMLDSYDFEVKVDRKVS